MALPHAYCDIGDLRTVRQGQAHIDDAVHSWYRLRLGYSDELVSSLIDEFGLDPARDLTLDPFCGSGTTLVECKKRGIPSIGIDANPSSCFATKVKTEWSLSQSEISLLLHELEPKVTRLRLTSPAIATDVTVKYLKSAGLLERGWICGQPLLEAIAIKLSIRKLRTSKAYEDFLMLALISEIIESAANVKFGPELYCGPRRRTVDVFRGFEDRVDRMTDDLEHVRARRSVPTRVIQGDSRNFLGSEIEKVNHLDHLFASLSSRARLHQKLSVRIGLPRSCGQRGRTPDD